MFLIQRHLAVICKSPIVKLDANNWLIDGIISGAVALAFLVIAFLQGTSFSWFISYADPSLVVIMVLSTIYIPYSIVKQKWCQLIGAIDTGFRNQVHSLVYDTISQIDSNKIYIRQGKVGRLVYVQVYIVVRDIDGWNVLNSDKLRYKLYSRLQKVFPYLASDIIFTSERIWVERAVLPAQSDNT